MHIYPKPHPTQIIVHTPITLPTLKHALRTSTTPFPKQFYVLKWP